LTLNYAIFVKVGIIGRKLRDTRYGDYWPQITQITQIKSRKLKSKRELLFGRSWLMCISKD